MQRPRTPTRNRRGAMPTTTTLSRSWRCRTRGWGRRPRRARQTSVRSWRRTACCGAARTTCALSTCRAGHSSCWANPRRASTAWNGPLRSSRTISPCSTTPPAASTTQEGRKRRSNCSTAPWIRGAAIAPGWSTTRTSTPCAACRDSSRSWRACRLDAARPPLRGRERPPGAQQRPAIEVEQLQRLIAHGELELPAIPLGVSADLERHLAVELDAHAVAEEVRHALARSDRPEVTGLAASDETFLHRDEVVEDGRIEPEPGERGPLALGAEQVQGPRARYFAGTRAQDVLDHAEAPAGRPREFRERVAGPETQDAEAGQLEAVGCRERRGARAVRADEEMGLAARHLVEDAVHVADEGAVAAAGEDGGIAAIEHGASDGAGIFEAAGEEEILGRHELLELAAKLLGDCARVSVEEDCDLLLRDRKALDVAVH